MILALPQVVAASKADLTSASEYDAVIAVYPTVCPVLLATFSSIAPYATVDRTFGSTLTLVPDQSVPGGRLILAPTGSIHGDSDDVRKFQEATKAAMKRAMAAGSVAPLFYFPTKIDASEDYSHYVEVSLLGALAACFEPIDVREHYEKIGKDFDVKKIGFIAAGAELTEERLAFVNAVETGRRVAKGKIELVCRSHNPTKRHCFCLLAVDRYPPPPS